LTKYISEKKKQIYNKFRKYTKDRSLAYFSAFLVEFKSIKGLSEQNKLTETEQLLVDITIDKEHKNKGFFTEFGQIDRTEVIIALNNQSILYTITKINIFNKPKVNTFSKPPANLVFILNNRYSDATFQDIILNNGTVGVSITRKPQVIAFQKLDLIISIDIFIAGNYKICFGKGEVIFISTIQISILLGNITFYVLPTNTLFLYCFPDIDRIKIKLDNIQNILV
jgi:hypothetical protein